MTRLLLVDDHQLLRQGLRRAMEEAGFAVVGEAADGEEALRLAEELRPQVILMDITMPVLGGIEATRRMPQHCPEARVVVLSMHGEEETVAQAIRAGAVGYLTKDCSMAEVAETVRMAATSEGAAVSPGIASSILTELAPVAQAPSVLSKREEEVLQLFADGCSPPEVAQRLFISAKTVKNHLASIYEKLDARDRTQAVLRAVRMGIVRID
jgi:DNA-binding NarL/FixJ family response regulator